MGCGISHPDPVAYRRGILPHTLIKYNSQIDFFSLNQCLWIMPENLEKETSKISFNFQLLLILKYEKKYAYENTLQFETKNFAIKLQVIIIIS